MHRIRSSLQSTLRPSPWPTTFGSCLTTRRKRRHKYQPGSFFLDFIVLEGKRQTPSVKGSVLPAAVGSASNDEQACRHAGVRLGLSQRSGAIGQRCRLVMRAARPSKSSEPVQERGGHRFCGIQMSRPRLTPDEASSAPLFHGSLLPHVAANNTLKLSRPDYDGARPLWASPSLRPPIEKRNPRPRHAYLFTDDINASLAEYHIPYA